MPCCPQLNASYVRAHYLYRASSLNKNRLYAKARKDNHTNGDCSITPTIYPFGMNTQGGFCDLAISALKEMAIKKYKNSWATKRKADWLKAQWVNETCRDLQAKVKSKPLLFATIVHFGVFTRIATSYCSPQDLSLYQPRRILYEIYIYT
jgi:hypothetical protein